MDKSVTPPHTQQGVAVCRSMPVVPQWPRGGDRAGCQEIHCGDRAHPHELLRVGLGDAGEPAVGMWDIISQGIGDYREDRNSLAVMLWAVPQEMQPG
jgi:hypothetical protein